MPIIVLIVLLLLAALAWGAGSWHRRRRREALLGQPLGAAQAAILAHRVPLYQRLPGSLQRRLAGLVNVFLADKRFEGCDGLVVTEEMRVTVAGHACLLLLGGGSQVFPGFRSILIYPGAFVSEHTEFDGVVETRGRSVRAGESWEKGPVVLSWSDIEEDLAYAGDGHNVVLHEFAHKLDEETQNLDGLPRLADAAQREAWARILGREYAALQRSAAAGGESLLDPYGAESPAEFFAVATEMFFENGALMKRRLPELYAQLGRYYNLDPAAW